MLQVFEGGVPAWSTQPRAGALKETTCRSAGARTEATGEIARNFQADV